MPVKQLIATERDLAFLTELGEVGLMSAQMIVGRHFGACSDKTSAERSFRRRMKMLVESGYVRTERVPLAGQKSGLVTVYRLTGAGGDLLAELTGRRPPRVGGSQELNPVTIPHRLGIVSTRLAFDDAHRGLGLSCPEWLFEYDLSPQADPTAGNDKKFVLYESFREEGRRVVCWPDAAARIRPPDASDHELLAYFEYDRSTETTKQFAAKVAGYRLLVATERYRQHWSHVRSRHAVRVLVVVRSVERLRSLIAAVSRIGGAELFRFASYEDLRLERLLTEPIWHTADGRILSIFRSHGSDQTGECSASLLKQRRSQIQTNPRR